MTDRVHRATLYVCNKCDHGVHVTIRDDPHGGLSLPACPVCDATLARQVPPQYEVPDDD